MNKKLLISALLFALISGCTTTNTPSVQTAGIGAGASKTPQKSSLKTIGTNITENSISSTTASKPAPSNYSDEVVETRSKNTDEETPVYQNTVILNSPSSKRRSHSNNKSFSPAAPTAKTPYPYRLSSEKIKVEVIKTNSQDKVYLQLGVFSSLANAKELQKKVVANQMPEPIIKEVFLNGKLAHRVQLGPILSTAKVNEYNTKLKKMGISETWYVTDNKI